MQEHWLVSENIGASAGVLCQQRSEKELAQKLGQLERKVGAHDKAIAEIINAIRQLMTPEEPKKKRPIGFAPWKENDVIHLCFKHN